MLRATSGQFLFFDLVSAISGNPVTGASGSISGRKATDAISGMIVLSGNIIELGGGMYRANLFDFDTSGLFIGYLFTASGCIPRSFSVVTTDASSGLVFPPSGSWSGRINVNLLSGQSVNVFSGQISGAFVNVHSGQLSGRQVDAFVRDVTAVSGLIHPASGMTFIASGTFVNVPKETISGVIANSGIFVTVPIESISGVIANSGLTVTVVKALLSGVVANSGLNVIAGSGAFAVASLNSGQEVLVYSGQLSGQKVDLLSGNQTQVWSGTQVNVFSGGLSGQPYSLVSGSINTNTFSSGMVSTAIPRGVWRVSGEIESGLNPRQAVQLIAAATAGESSGAGASFMRFNNPVGDDVVRITMGCDQSGNRTSGSWSID